MRAFFYLLAGLGALVWLGWWLLPPIGLLAALVGGTLRWLHHEKVTDERRAKKTSCAPEPTSSQRCVWPATHAAPTANTRPHQCDCLPTHQPHGFPGKPGNGFGCGYGFLAKG